jgi:hypothetical protein
MDALSEKDGGNSGNSRTAERLKSLEGNRTRFSPGNRIDSQAAIRINEQTYVKGILPVLFCILIRLTKHDREI